MLFFAEILGTTLGGINSSQRWLFGILIALIFKKDYGGPLKTKPWRWNQQIQKFSPFAIAQWRIFIWWAKLFGVAEIIDKGKGGYGGSKKFKLLLNVWV